MNSDESSKWIQAGEQVPAPAAPERAPSPDVTTAGQWIPGETERAQAPLEQHPSLLEKHPSLARQIAEGNPDTLAGFHDAHVRKVRSYCAHACQAEAVDEAVEASFVDFVARVREAAMEEPPLGDLLLAGTRSAAASRFVVEQPTSDICLAMPELLGALANGELGAESRQMHEHLKRCPACQATAARMQEAERAFAESTGWEEPGTVAADREPEPSASEPEPEPSASEPEPEPGPSTAEPEPEPQLQASQRLEPPPPPAQPPPPQPSVVRARSGGLVGAAKKLGRQLSGNPPSDNRPG